MSNKNDALAAFRGKNASDVAKEAQIKNAIIGNFDAAWIGVSFNGEKSLLTFNFKPDTGANVTGMGQNKYVPIWIQHIMEKDEFDAALVGADKGYNDVFEMMKGNKERAKLIQFINLLYTLDVLKEDGTWVKPSSRRGKTVYLMCNVVNDYQQKNFGKSRNVADYEKEDLRFSASDEVELYLEDIEKQEGGAEFIKKVVKLIKDSEIIVVPPRMYSGSHIASLKIDSVKMTGTLIVNTSAGRCRVYLDAKQDADAQKLVMLANLAPSSAELAKIPLDVMIGVDTSQKTGNEYNILMSVARSKSTADAELPAQEQTKAPANSEDSAEDENYD